MRKGMQIGIGTAAEALDRFERVWNRAERGLKQPADVRLSFVDLPTLLKNLTPARWTLLEALRRHGPVSINELATRLGRHYKNVHTDVSRLMALGLIERRANRRVAVDWDVVTAEMRLAG